MSPISRRSNSALSRKGGAARIAPTTLADLHRAYVAVHIVVQGREQFVRGTASYEADADLGHALHVLVSDPDGNFEIVVAESHWDGKILPGQAVGCEYLIRLH
jgi:hypothetical protein